MNLLLQKNYQLLKRILFIKIHLIKEEILNMIIVLIQDQMENNKQYQNFHYNFNVIKK